MKMSKLTEIGKAEISDDGKVIVRPHPEAIVGIGQRLLLYSRDGDLYVATLHEEDEGVDVESCAFDPKINLSIPTKNKPVITVKRVLAYGNGQHIIIDRTLMEGGNINIGDLVYVYLLKVEEGEEDG